jgi:ubiquinone/menaquinone biosynthesis C-methylase UbiE
VLERLNERGCDVNLRAAPQLREYEEIADRIAADRVEPILDWGCGWGQMSDLLRRRGLEVQSFDFRPQAEQSGLRRLSRFPEIEAFIETEDPVRLPYDEGEFAAVLSCGVLEHVARPEESVHELRRVLRPGGRLYVYKLPNRFSYLEAIARRLGMYYHGEAPEDRVYDRRSAERLLQSHGFSIQGFRRSNMLPLTLTGRVVERAAGGIWTANRVLAKVPILNLASTNLELLAIRR